MTRGSTGKGHTLVPHAQTCDTAVFFTFSPNASGVWAFPVCKSELATFATSHAKPGTLSSRRAEVGD
ncbi:MAG: hypothetical protein HYY13_08495 [Nitrospirae bacterium]|nr:hypothetical protein [Nitrospirota bacterium]